MGHAPSTRGWADLVNAAQEAAIKRLEGALLGCADAGVLLCGMDQTLCAYPRDLMDEAADKGAESAYEEQKYCIERGEDRPIKHYGAYRDSGGW